MSAGSATVDMVPLGLLARERTIAQPGFNRWLVPPAALAIQLCIGMAYGFSVFWLPLSRAIGGDQSVVCPDLTLWQALFTTSCDWRVSDLGWMYTLFFVFLGSSAAIWGGWLERAGPRKAGAVAALCWGGGFLVSAVGIATHQLWLMWLGSGVIGGIGLGLGYISPVSTLIKWFPDRRGLATGMAIMGFGGGAMIGAPLADLLMNGGTLLNLSPIGLNYELTLSGFRTATSPGVWQTFVVLGLAYMTSMMCGAFGYRVPPTNWAPEGWTPPPNRNRMITKHHVHFDDALKTPQFWLIWMVLFLNVSAGIGVIGMASPMLQEIFAGKLIGLPDLTFSQLDADQKLAIAAIAAGFTGLLSLFNIGGRIFWASLSDSIGRKMTYFTFFVAGMVLYAVSPWAAHFGSVGLFVICICVILSMYGGGFSTVPAYLADVFGTQFVGAIHGRLLTAWSAAGIVGPVTVNYVRQFQIDAGVPRDQVYDFTMYILAGLLVLGFLCNLAIRPVSARWHMKHDASAPTEEEQAFSAVSSDSGGIGRGGASFGALLAWLAVSIPLGWGIWVTVGKAIKLFG